MNLLGITFEAGNINGLNCDAIVGYPAPLTFWQFGHVLERHLRQTVPDCRVRSMLVFHHEFALMGLPGMSLQIDPNGISRNWSGRAYVLGKTRQGAPTAEGGAAPILENIFARIKATVVYELDSAEDSDRLYAGACAWLGLDPKAKSHAGTPVFGRFAGGVLEDASVFLVHEPDALAAQMPPARLLTGDPLTLPAPDAFRLGPHEQPVYDGVAAYLDHLAPAKGRGYRIPTLIGYVLLEPPVAGRRRARDPKVPHAFAEPLLGSAQFVAATEDAMRYSFWRLVRQDQVFVCTTGRPVTELPSL